jgi:predicted small integral membrane protein
VTGRPDPQALLTALTTEHFTLQGARSQTMSESSARGALYIGSLSSALVALGFIGQISQAGDLFNTFALTVLPTVYLLGVFTFVRLVECGAEDFRYGVAINRIRHHYQQLAGEEARLFLLSGHDDGEGVFANMGLPAEGRKPYFAFSTAICLVNSVVGGSAVAIALGAFVDASLAVAASVGLATAVLSAAGWLRFANRLLDLRAATTESLFPSPAPGGRPGATAHESA